MRRCWVCWMFIRGWRFSGSFWDLLFGANKFTSKTLKMSCHAPTGLVRPARLMQVP